MEVTSVRVRPRQLRNGQYVLDLITRYDETIPGKPWAFKSKSEVLLKGANGRGRMFLTRRAAREYHRDHLDIKEHG